MIDFETKVLQVVYRVLGPDDHAEFYNGTLFAECSDSTADLIHGELYQALVCGVISSKAGPECSFDFY